MPGALWGRVLTGVAFAAVMVTFTAGPAQAATEKRFTEQYSDGAQVVPGSDNSYKTRSVARTQASNTWDDWVWRGRMDKCPSAPGTRDCQFTYSESKTTTSGWNVGGGVELGNASSPSKKWYNVVLSLVGGYGRSTTVTTNYDRSVTVDPGVTVQLVQVVVRRWTRGDYVGGWVRTNRTCGGYPIANTVYEWRGEHRFGQWTRHNPNARWYNWAATECSACCSARRAEATVLVNSTMSTSAGSTSRTYPGARVRNAASAPISANLRRSAET